MRKARTEAERQMSMQQVELEPQSAECSIQQGGRGRSGVMATHSPVPDIGFDAGLFGKCANNNFES